MYRDNPTVKDTLTSGTLLLSFFSGAPQVMQGVFLTRLEDLVSRKTAIFFLGLFFGSGVVKDTELISLFQQVGLSHVLSASGFNLRIVARVLGLGGEERLDGVRRMFILSGIVFYAWIAGFTPSVVRSACQLAYFLLAEGFGRVVHPVLGIILPSLFALLMFPHWISSVSFWLSLAAGLGFSLPLSRNRQRSEGCAPVRSNFFLEDLQATVRASCFTVPIIAGVFGEFSLIGFIANPLILWTLRYWMIVAIILFAVSFAQIPQFVILAEFAQILLSLQMRLLDFLGKLPGSTFFLGRFRWIFGLSWIFMLLLLFYRHYRSEKYANQVRSRLRTND